MELLTTDTLHWEWIDAHRRFAEALETIRLNKLTKDQIEALMEYHALVLFGKLYADEDMLKNCTPEERLS